MFIITSVPYILSRLGLGLTRGLKIIAVNIVSWSLIVRKDFSKGILIRKDSSAEGFRRGKNFEEEINSLIVLSK